MTNRSIVLNRVKNLVKKLIHFIYPSYCIHCRETAVDPRELFCLHCKELMERFPLDLFETHNKAVAVEKEGAARSLLNEVKRSLSQEALSTMAALMAVQVIELNWPVPDLIIPFPKDPINTLLAKELSTILGAPFEKDSRNCCDQTVLAVALTLDVAKTLDPIEEAAPLQIFQIGFCQV